MSEFIRSVAISVSRQDPRLAALQYGWGRGKKKKRCDTLREREREKEGGEDENSRVGW